MEKIEIRQDKKLFLIILVLVVVMQVFVIRQIYFTNNGNTTVKVVFGVVALISFYSLYLPIKRLIRNEPVLTFSKSEITIIEKNKPVSYLWLQVNEWKIEKDFDGDGKYLILETTGGKKKGQYFFASIGS